jgi:hypothetical protein
MSSRLLPPSEVVSSRLARQAAWCAELGSPFYAFLLNVAAKDVAAEGVVWDVLTGFEEEHGGSALALRFMGAVHRLVLTGRLPELELRYPSVGGDGDAAAAWPGFQLALIDHRSEIRDLLDRGCQTNEVGRSAALLGGFLEITHRTGLPLRILEIGASAGLNLRWDRYRYESGAQAWGDPDSPVRFTDSFEVAPPLDRQAEVAERKGCDLAPIEPATDEGSLTLRSFIWADQPQRMRRLEGAILVASQMAADIHRLDAADFLERELPAPRPGVATVVYHSVFIQYIGAQGRERIARAIAAAASRASAASPLAWLRLEPAAREPSSHSGTAPFEVRLNLWPGGEEELIALSQAHGTGVRWLVS